MTATITHHHNLQDVVAGVGEAMGVRDHDEAITTAADAITSFEGEPRDGSTEPGAAASAVPVVASVGILFVVAVGFAYGGRAIIDAVASMLGM